MALFGIVSICKGGGYRYCRTDPPHPKRNALGLYPLHRVRAENKMGRLLREDEVVHHKNDDPTDDRSENLEVMSRVEHGRRHHQKLDRVRLVCPVCGSPFSLAPRHFRTRMKHMKAVPKRLHCSRQCEGARRKC